MSGGAFAHRFGEGGQEGVIAGQAAQRGDGGGGLFVGEGPGFFEAVEFYVGGFIGACVFAGGFAQGGGVAGGIEDIVDDLE